MAADSPYSRPLRTWMNVFVEMPTEKLLAVMDTDEVIAWRFFGRPYPRKVDTETQRVIDDYHVRAVPDLMLMLLEREFGLTSNPRAITCLDQFRAGLAADFSKWLADQGSTVAGVARLFQRLFFNPAYRIRAATVLRPNEQLTGLPDQLSDSLIVALPIIFAWNGKQLVWCSFISTVYAGTTVWIPVLTLSRLGPISTAYYSRERTVITTKATLRGVVVAVQVQLKSDSGLIAAGFTIRFADQPGSICEPIPAAAVHFYRSLFSSRREDGAAQGMTSTSESLTYHADNDRSTTIYTAPDAVVYLDYEAVIAADGAWISVNYRCTPPHLSPNTSVLPLVPVKGQLLLPTPDAAETAYACRLDKVGDSGPFGAAVMWFGDTNTFVEIASARNDGTVYHRESYELPVAFNFKRTFKVRSMRGNAELIVLRAAAVGAMFKTNRATDTDNEPREHVVALSRTTNALTIGTWLGELDNINEMYKRADLRRVFHDPPNEVQNLQARRLI